MMMSKIAVALAVVSAAMMVSASVAFPESPCDNSEQYQALATEVEDFVQAAEASCVCGGCTSNRTEIELGKSSCLILDGSEDQKSLDFLKRRLAPMCIMVSPGAVVDEPIKLGAGRDCVMVEGTVKGIIDLGKNNDFVKVSSTGKVEMIRGQEGNDVFWVLGVMGESSPEFEVLKGDEGNDTFLLQFVNQPSGDIQGDRGSDVILMQDSVVDEAIGKDGEDMVLLFGSSAKEARLLSEGDLIYLENSQVDDITEGKGGNAIVLGPGGDFREHDGRTQPCWVSSATTTSATTTTMI